MMIHLSYLASSIARFTSRIEDEDGLSSLLRMWSEPLSSPPTSPLPDLPSSAVRTSCISLGLTSPPRPPRPQTLLLDIPPRLIRSPSPPPRSFNPQTVEQIRNAPAQLQSPFTSPRSKRNGCCSSKADSVSNRFSKSRRKCRSKDRKEPDGMHSFTADVLLALPEQLQTISPCSCSPSPPLSASGSSREHAGILPTTPPPSIVATEGSVVRSRSHIPTSPVSRGLAFHRCSSWDSKLRHHRHHIYLRNPGATAFSVAGSRNVTEVESGCESHGFTPDAGVFTPQPFSSSNNSHTLVHAEDPFSSPHSDATTGPDPLSLTYSNDDKTNPIGCANAKLSNKGTERSDDRDGQITEKDTKERELSRCCQNQSGIVRRCTDADVNPASRTTTTTTCQCSLSACTSPSLSSRLPSTGSDLESARSSDMPWRIKYRRQLWMLATVGLVVTATVGILGGIISKLQEISD